MLEGLSRAGVFGLVAGHARYWTPGVDFLTAAAYVAIVVLVLANALLVSRLEVKVRRDEDDSGP